MPWKERSPMDLRLELVTLASAGSISLAELCGRFGISRKTAYKWLDRYRKAGLPGLKDQSRCPLSCPWQSGKETEQAVLAIREAHPAWGGRKIRARLQDLGSASVPSASTITAILHRAGRIDPETSQKHGAFQRFEHAAPNDLWQMDFKGHFGMQDGRRCHPLTVLDDHSRYAIGLQACGNERTETVQQRLTRIFRHYGLPRRILCDNGPPFGASDCFSQTALTVWLMRVGVEVSHGRPRHPQTQGKDERFHRTLGEEVLRRRQVNGLEDCQVLFDDWRKVYNHERPHEALGMKTPASRYQPSRRSYPDPLPPIEYEPGDEVRRVQNRGEISIQGRLFFVGRALIGEPVGLRPTRDDGVFAVYYCHQALGSIDLRRNRSQGEASKPVTTRWAKEFTEITKTHRKKKEAKKKEDCCC